MKNHLRPAIFLFVLFTLLCGTVYPAVTTLIIQALFPEKSEGSLIVKDGKVLGSELLGQNFTDPKYFWGRLSATTPLYNTANSSGSNLGAANPALLDAVKGRIAALKKADPNNTSPIPVDLITASASGLDPSISPAAAQYQAERVARARGMNVSAVQDYIHKYTQERQFGFLGEPTVNVLMLNLALDGKL